MCMLSETIIKHSWKLQYEALKWDIFKHLNLLLSLREILGPGKGAKKHFITYLKIVFK